MTALLVMSVCLVSCQQDELIGELPAAREGYVALRFSADIPVMETQNVSTRSVDPDGGGVQTMTLFCFDNYGSFITTVKADLSPTDDLTGNFTAEVPENTRRVHFVANQNMDSFKEDDFRNKSESEVMALLEGSSGRMIYWARFACTPDSEGTKTTIAEQLTQAGGTITLIRNHALVTVGNPTGNGYLEVTGFAAYNTNAFGTVAPYHPDKGFAFTLDEWKSGNFVTLPVNDTKISDITDVTTATRQYIFESENRLEDPVSIIIRGHAPGESTDKYYRVMLVDENGNQIPIRRNHSYTLNIAGALSFGQDSFEAALEASATNNVWISISDEVNEVEDKNYILTVEKTFEVIDEGQVQGGTYTFKYTLKGKNGIRITEADRPEISWIDNSVASQGIDEVFSIENNVGNGSINITLRPLGNNEKLEGTLLVKHGRLQRKIKVIMVKKQSFVPAWIGTAVYGDIDMENPTQGRSHVTVMFTVPENCPAELFPMKVYISVNELDVRAESGMNLTVVRSADKEWYSSGDITPEPDYKYMYTVEKPGVQRVYFENILSQSESYTGNLYIEAEHFATMERMFTFSNTRKSITIEGLKAYSNVPNNNPDEFAKDEYVLYRLVPQKKNAVVQFDLQLREKTGDEIEGDQQGNPFNADAKDEFLLYSKYLSDYQNPSEAGVLSFDCKFYPTEADRWWQEHNPQGGRMLMFKPINTVATETGRYSIYMHTNRAKSAEVVRIASNQQILPPVLPGDADDVNTNMYGGNFYRSVTFELANYNPFRFGARVKYADEEWQGAAEEPDRTTTTADVPEKVTPLTWTYQPDRKVDIAIDVTSFKGSDDKSVDPFGEEFEIYIDAPMLKIDESRLDENLKDGKLKAHPSIPGRFIYTVAAKREDERWENSTEEVVNKDGSVSEDVQQGERKTLPFLTNSIVSAGDIVISSNEEQVVFYSKTFRATNETIKGQMQYRDKDGALHDVSPSAFVAFERTSDGSRIGVVTVKENGEYELHLRKEYDFTWNGTGVEFHYDLDGQVYHAPFTSLSALFEATGVILNPEN